MARIEITPEQEEDPRIAETFAWVRAQGIEVPALYRGLGAAPDMLKAWVDFAWTLRDQAKTPRALRELAILRGAQVAGVVYEWAHHVPMATAAGVSSAKIDALKSWRESDLFDPSERAALACAEEVAGGDGASAETMEALKDALGEAGAVEIALTASFYACVARVLTSLGIEVEPGYRDQAASFDP